MAMAVSARRVMSSRLARSWLPNQLPSRPLVVDLSTAASSSSSSHTRPGFEHPAVAESVLSSSSSSSSSYSASASGTGAENADPSSGAHEENGRRRSSVGKTAVKTLLFGAAAAALASSAYISCAYTSDELEKRISEYRLQAIESNNPSDGTALDNLRGMFYSTSMKALSSVADAYLNARKPIEDQVQSFTAPASDKLLPDLLPQEQHVFTLVLDLNETLVYTDWKRDRGWQTFKRPGVDAFLEHLAQYYELVIYSDQLWVYVDPILERLDQKGCIRYRLTREATYYKNGKHYRDISKLNRNPARVIYLSANALETCLQPENTIAVKPWKLESEDATLLDLLPFLEYVARYRPTDIRPVLTSYQGCDIPTEFRERSKDYQRKVQGMKKQGRFWQGSAVGRGASSS